MKDQGYSGQGNKWQTVPLAEAAVIGAGNSAPQGKELFKNGHHPFIRTSDVGQIGFGEIGHARDLLNDAGVEKLRRVPKGAILMPKSGASTFLNHRVETAVDAYISSHLATIEAREGKALPRYLLYYLSTVRAQDLIQDHKYPSLTLGVISKILVPLPPLEEQKRIVAVLDQAFAALDRARANAEANLADAEKLFENHLRLTFADLLASWGSLPFDKACETITPVAKIQQRDYLTKGEFPIVAQGAEFVAGYWNDYSAVTETGGPVVIFGDHTRHLKHVDFTFVAGADGTKILRPVDGLRSDFLFFALRSQPIEVTGYARHFKFLKEKVVPELPMPDQETLCRSLWEMEGECNRLQANYEQKLTDISDLRQSLLQKAFSGQLTA